MHFHESKSMSRSRHEYRMVCEYVMRRRTSEDSHASFQHQARTARARSTSPRPSTNFAAHALRSSSSSGNEGVAPSQGLHQFQSRLGVCTVASIRSSHTLAIRPVPCRAWPRARPSTSVCSFSRISKRFTVSIAYLALQRVYSTCNFAVHARAYVDPIQIQH